MRRGLPDFTPLTRGCLWEEAGFRKGIWLTQCMVFKAQVAGNLEGVEKCQRGEARGGRDTQVRRERQVP
jgi:hypothetical protein